MLHNSGHSDVQVKNFFFRGEGELSSHFKGSKVALNVSTFEIPVPRIPARNTSSIFYPGEFIQDSTVMIKLVHLSLPLLLGTNGFTSWPVVNSCKD